MSSSNTVHPEIDVCNTEAPTADDHHGTDRQDSETGMKIVGIDGGGGPMGIYAHTQSYIFLIKYMEERDEEEDVELKTIEDSR